MLGISVVEAGPVLDAMEGWAGRFTFTFTFSHFADAFIQSDLQLGNT